MAFLHNSFPLHRTSYLKSPLLQRGGLFHSRGVDVDQGAHRGILFLDEQPGSDSRGLEILRQPLNDKILTISRAQGSLMFPANFMLIGAMKPCPCGFLAIRRRNVPIRSRR